MCHSVPLIEQHHPRQVMDGEQSTPVMTKIMISIYEQLFLEEIALSIFVCLNIPQLLMVEKPLITSLFGP